MLPRFPVTILSWAFEAICLSGIAFLYCLSALGTETRTSVIVCRETLSSQRRDQLSNKLRKITGWQQLHFDQDGRLDFGTSAPTKGSETARELLEKAAFGPAAVILEDASKRQDVAFSRVIPGKWKHEISQSPVYVILIDFSDFEQLTGDHPALEAFNEGWALFHELDHVVHNSVDAEDLEDPGECEKHINQMRKECNLPQRISYFYTPYPKAHKNEFKTAYVRLPFELITKADRKKRYWLVWDAATVGLGAINHSVRKR